MERTFAVNDIVQWRGMPHGQFYLRGQIEVIEPAREIDPYGVRFVNGNFTWSKSDQMRLTTEFKQKINGTGADECPACWGIGEIGDPLGGLQTCPSCCGNGYVFLEYRDADPETSENQPPSSEGLDQ